MYLLAVFLLKNGVCECKDGYDWNKEKECVPNQSDKICNLNEVMVNEVCVCANDFHLNEQRKCVPNNIHNDDENSGNSGNGLH